MQGLLEMSPHPKQVVDEQPVDVVQARVLYRVVLGLVPMSGCGWDLVLLNRICSQQSFIFLVSIRLKLDDQGSRSYTVPGSQELLRCPLVMVLLLPLLILLHIVCYIWEKRDLGVRPSKSLAGDWPVVECGVSVY
ncbi:hypothetical protein EMCRGX_G021679 [Ephydatia muelleri]